MEKNIEWLKEEIPNLRGYAVIIDGEGGEWEPVTTVSMEDVYELINQLDEQEVLSQEWIDEHITDGHNVNLGDKVVYVDKLDGVLVPKQEEVKIESLWAEDIEEAKENGMTLFKTMNWMGIDSDEKEKQDLFARAWLDGYEIEQEPKYYAKIKGHELTDHTRQYWYFFKVDESLNIGMKPNHPLHIGKLNKIEWANLGINDGNADFELVEEVSENV